MRFAATTVSLLPGWLPERLSAGWLCAFGGGSDALPAGRLVLPPHGIDCDCEPATPRGYCHYRAANARVAAAAFWTLPLPGPADCVPLPPAQPAVPPPAMTLFHLLGRLKVLQALPAAICCCARYAFRCCWRLRYGAGDIRRWRRARGRLHYPLIRSAYHCVTR